MGPFNAGDPDGATDDVGFEGVEGGAVEGLVEFEGGGVASETKD